MKIVRLFIKIFLFVGALGLLHVLAIYFDFYKGKIWIDIPLHILGGIALGFIWVWILDFRAQNEKEFPGLLLFIFSLFGWVLIFSFAWEAFEFLIRENSPELANAWKIYPPNLADTLSDIAFGLLGGFLSGILSFALRYKKFKNLNQS